MLKFIWYMVAVSMNLLTNSDNDLMFSDQPKEITACDKKL